MAAVSGTPGSSTRLTTLAVGLVVAAAVGTFMGWWWASGTDVAVPASLGVLLLAVPVGLLLAPRAPVALARRRGAAHGVRIGGLPAVVAAEGVDTVVVAAHGTVTTGELTVIGVEAVEPDHDRNLRWFAGALEHASQHPVGHAIARLSGRGRLADVREWRGLGISGSVDRHPVRIGRPGWIGLDTRNGVGTTVAVEVDARGLGYITVADVVRPGARSAVERLRGLGLDPVLVADAPALDTERVAEATGITHAHAETAPEKRPTVVRELQEQGHVVAMAGDATTNAEALGVADLAITDGPDGPDWPDQPAVAVIELDDLDITRVVRALGLARRTHGVIRSNRRLAVAAMLLPVPVVALVPLGVPVAAAIVAAGTLLVGINSLRLGIPAEAAGGPDPDE